MSSYRPHRSYGSMRPHSPSNQHGASGWLPAHGGPTHCPKVSTTLQPPYPMQPGFLSSVRMPHLCALRLITGSPSSKKSSLISPVGCHLTVLEHFVSPSPRPWSMALIPGHTLNSPCTLSKPGTGSGPQEMLQKVSGTGSKQAALGTELIFQLA